MQKGIIPVLLLSVLTFALFSQTKNDFYDTQSIQEIRMYFTEPNWDHILDSLFLNYGEDARLQGNIKINGELFQKVGVRYKGYSSWDVNQKKSPFNVELDYAFKNQNYQGYTKLKLSNVIRDPSFVREVLSYEILRKYMPAPEANFANVYVNDTLIGLYTNVEAVNKEFAISHFGSGKNSFFKGSPDVLVHPYGENANLAHTHGNDSSGYYPFYKLESDYGWTDIYNFIDVLNNDTTALSNILNIDRTLWMHAFNYALLNLDSYIGYSQNYYMYKDDNGIFNPIVWDLNMSFGSFRQSDGTSIDLSIQKMKELDPLGIINAGQTSFSSRPLIKNILDKPMYQRMFLAHIRTILEENITNGTFYNRGNELQILIDSAVYNDPNKFYAYNNFKKNLDSTVGPTANQFPGIKDVMEGRISYLNSYKGIKAYPQISDIQVSPAQPIKNQTMTITVNSSDAIRVLLGYRTSSHLPFQKTMMADDGQNGDEMANDYIFSKQIYLNGDIFQFFVYAENDSAGVFLPERAEYEYFSVQPELQEGDIVLNEITQNYIELFNNTNESYSLKNCYFSDNENNIQNWQLPDTTILAKKYFTFYNNLIFLTGLKLDFYLPEKNGALFFSEKNTILDKVLYGSLRDNVSFGRYPNGKGAFMYMKPSISFCNTIGITYFNKLKVYPNPASEYLNIEIADIQDNITLEIFNSLGKCIEKAEYSFVSGITNDIISIQTSNLPSGMYYLNCITAEKILKEIFIVKN